MEQIKEAFSKVKQDIDFLKREILLLNKGLLETRESLVEICEVLKALSKKTKENKEEENLKSPSIQEEATFSQKEMIPAHQQVIPTTPLSIPTHPKENTPQNPQKAQNQDISTGNEGVPTDRQTDQQTNQHIDKSSYNHIILQQENPINNAAQILDSLDNLKKEIRLKFKRLTDQEFLVFSSIYQASEETGYTDYKNLSEKLNLTESSIRDYIGRLIKKGIPLDKIKINNKTVHVSISQNLKKVATLPTILQLRSI